MAIVNEAVNQDKKEFKDAVTSALSALDQVIANVEGSTLLQTQQAVRILAQNQKKIIKRLAQIDIG